MLQQRKEKELLFTMSKTLKLATITANTILLILSQTVLNVNATAIAIAAASPDPIPDAPVSVRRARENEYPPIRMHYRRIDNTGRSTSSGQGFGASDTNSDIDDDINKNNNNNNNWDSWDNRDSSNSGYLTLDIPLEQIIENVQIGLPDPAGSAKLIARDATFMIGVSRRPARPRQLSGGWEGRFSGGPADADEVRCSLSTARDSEESQQLDFAVALEEWARLGQTLPIPADWRGVTCVAFVYHS